jgi:hypothetical protein
MGRSAGERGYREVLPPLLRIIERSLTVADVAETSLKFVKPSWSLRRTAGWLKRMRFDFAPVAEDPPRRYVAREDLEQGLRSQGTAPDVARPIDATHLATASLGLADGVLLLKEAGFFFVMEGNKLRGIVTKADLQRPAVSMVTLSLALAAEGGMDEIIENRHGQGWQNALSPKRLRTAEEIFREREKHEVDTQLLQCIMLADRMTLIGKLPPVTEFLGFRSKAEFGRWARKLEFLRNKLAHGGDIFDVEGDPDAAIDLFRRVKGFAEQIWSVPSLPALR